MISGVEITDLTKQHANELIQQAKKMKNNIMKDPVIIERIIKIS